MKCLAVKAPEGQEATQLPHPLQSRSLMAAVPSSTLNVAALKGQVMAQVLQAYFQEVNDRGGIYRRRIELLVVPYGGNEEETLANLRAALAREGIFALV